MINKNKRGNYLFKNTIILSISNISSNLISFFLIPIYTWKLSTSDYGIVDLLFTICTFLYPLLSLNVTEAIYRFSMDKGVSHNKISSIGLICNILCVVLGLFTIPILNMFDSLKNYSIVFYFYLITLCLSQTLIITLKGKEKLKHFTIASIINSFFTALFNIIFLIKFNMGIKGYFLGYIMSNLIVIIYAFIFTDEIKNFKSFVYDSKLFKQMINYSFLLIPTSFMWWIINSSDRIMVSSMISTAANGIYSISYKIPSLLTILASIFIQAWMYSAVNEKDSNDKNEFVNSIFKKFFVFLNIVAMTLLLFIKPLFRVFVNDNFYDAWKYVPFLIFGFVFMTASTFLSTSYNVHKDSKGLLISGFIGAVCNVVLNFILIPLIGTYGAALATLISYISVFLFRFFDTKKYIKVNFNYYLLIFFLLVCSILTYFNKLYFTLIQLGLIIIVIAMYRKTIIEFACFIKNVIKGVVRR